MSIVIIGNGIIGLTTAYRLAKKQPQVSVRIIGPSHHKGCASLAAAAMLNSFCEVDPDTLGNPILKERFTLNRAAVPLWPEFLSTLMSDSGVNINHGFGTYLIHNHAADELDDANFKAVEDALKIYNEPYTAVDPQTIPNYMPTSSVRAAKAIFIPNEGWVNPVDLLEALKTFLRKQPQVAFVDGNANSIECSGGKVQSVRLENGESVDGDRFLLCPGANFTRIVEKSNLPIQLPKVFYGVGCSILLKTGDVTHSHCVRTPNRGLACGIYSAPFDHEHTIVGASNFISPVSEDFARLTSVHTLLEAAMDQINTLFYRSQLVKVNVGWRPTSEDTLPILGTTSVDNLVIAGGTKRDGLHCSPFLSNLMASLIMEESIDYDLSLYAPERNARRIYGREQAIESAVNHTLNAAYQHGYKASRNRINEDLRKYYTSEFTALHDQVGAKSWGIPPELLNMYKYGHIK